MTHFDLLQTIGIAGDATRPNDDRCGVATRLAWVIDGATDLGDPGLMGAQGGAAWLAAAATNAFAAAPHRAIADVVAAVFGRVADAYGAERVRDPLGAWEHPSAAFLAASLDGTTLHVAWLADCACLLLDGDTITRLGPQADRAETDSARALAGPPARVTDALREQRMRPQRRVLGIDPAHAAHVLHTRATVRRGDELLLMTDGMAALFDDYGVPVADIVAMLRSDGLPALAARVRAIERADADCTRHPRFKCSDDATALWLRIAGRDSPG